jgi:hypothetical protein
VLLADEFQTLLYCNDTVQTAFLAAIQILVDAPAGTGFCLHAMLGFGTYSILQLTKVAHPLQLLSLSLLGL